MKMTDQALALAANGHGPQRQRQVQVMKVGEHHVVAALGMELIGEVDNPDSMSIGVFAIGGRISDLVGLTEQRKVLIARIPCVTRPQLCDLLEGKEPEKETAA
jgi:hypothetical protein